MPDPVVANVLTGFAKVGWLKALAPQNIAACVALPAWGQTLLAILFFAKRGPTDRQSEEARD